MSESIYNLIPQPVPDVIKPAQYISKHGGDKPPTFSTFGLSGTSKPGYKNIQGAEAAVREGHHVFKKSHATMGKEGNARPPSDMLKKGTGGGGGAADANAFGNSGVCLPCGLGRATARTAAQEGSRRPLACDAIPSPRGLPHAVPALSVRFQQHALPAAAHRAARSSLCALTAAFKYSDRLRPGVPTKAECLELSRALKKTDTKNFITSNAVENILAVPKREVSRRPLDACTPVGPLGSCAHRCFVARVPPRRRRVWTG